MHTRRRQAGFTIIEAVILFAVVAALAGLSFTLYQHIRQSATTSRAASNPNQSSQIITPPAPTITYLNIQEWGIKLPLSATIKDAYYVPSSQNQAADGTPLAMFIGLKSFDAAGCNAHTANTPGGISTILGTIIRIAPTDVDHVSGIEYVKEWPSATIGQYAYALHDVTRFRTCASSNTLKSISTALSNATTSATLSTN